MRNRLLLRATFGTAATLLAAGAVIGAPGTSSAAPQHGASAAAVTSDHRGQDRYDRDCDGHSAYPYGGYYGGGLGLLSWLL
ncbi:MULTISPECIES: hypothetical protein [Streptomyces]|uniref:Uncharacterized protein n=1 Tax=Streptomyces tardus TaxID=2780544 RepID=A0A949JFJ2_9ACTN|nr:MULTISPECIES: hypothetical protein [Streptomyces]MBU7599168.1 hypothetical protein [Streptomyces tardus]RPK51500.1 hypothetical protein EES40_04110 [Streptomyces sp. ADI93-02]